MFSLLSIAGAAVEVFHECFAQLLLLLFVQHTAT
jgi:hypothetical protein